MRGVGYVLLVVGFLAGSLVAVQTAENHVEWARFVPALVLAVVGVGLARNAMHRASRHESVVGANVEALHDSLARVVERLASLDATKRELDPYDVHGKIDELFPDELTRFADARETIAHLYGLQAYAAVMTEFAAAERYLNRVWSASVDGYVDEVQLYLGRALEQFTLALEKLRALGPARQVTPR